jgi:uncharacterized LabA/DUF88 family protein
MSRLVLQIDGGYLRAAANKWHIPYSNNFIDAVARTLVDGAWDNLLRVMYYDAPPYNGTQRRPVSGTEKEFSGRSDWLDELASREFFAVRRGTVKWRGWKIRHPENINGAPSDDDYAPDFQQKGVDLRIGVDMVSFAYERAAERVMLVAGDTDFIPAMKIARRRGLRVIGVPMPGFPLSGEFRQHVDVLKPLHPRFLETWRNAPA